MNPPFVAGVIAAFLAIAKFTIGVVSGSLAVLSSAIDSLLDCLISVLNYFAFKKSSDSPNQKFNFGYGKIEALVALFEGSLIVGIGGFICYFSVMKFFSHQGIGDIKMSLIAMVISVFATGALVVYLNSEYKKTANLIIKADALHYKTDLYTNLAILVALFIIHLTGYDIIDAIFGLGVSFYIIFSAFGLIKDGIYMLLDGSLDPKIISRAIEIIQSKNDVKSFHYLKTRKSGNVNFFSIHLVFDPSISLSKAHSIGDEIQNEIALEFDGEWNFQTHFDITDDSLKEIK